MKLLKALYLALAFCVTKLRGLLALVRFKVLCPSAGTGTRCPLSVELKSAENITIGKNVAIGPMTTLGGYGGIILEDYVRISKGVVIETASLDLSGSLPYKHIGKPVVVKRGAWLGARSIILGGVTVGENAVIGAGAVVSKDVAPGEIVVSQPVRSLRVST